MIMADKPLFLLLSASACRRRYKPGLAWSCGYIPSTNTHLLAKEAHADVVPKLWRVGCEHCGHTVLDQRHIHVRVILRAEGRQLATGEAGRVGGGSWGSNWQLALPYRRTTQQMWLLYQMQLCWRMLRKEDKGQLHVTLAAPHLND